MKISVSFMAYSSVIGGCRSGVRGRLHAVVNRHRRAVTQLHLPGRDNDIARFHAAEHGDLIAACPSGGHKGLPRRMCGTLLLDKVHRAAVWIIGDRRLRQRDVVLWRTYIDVDGGI